MEDKHSTSLTEIESALIACRDCPRLVAWREEVAVTKRRAFINEEYWGKPVPGFGDPAARVQVVGLAPGAHGSNRTGRMFTGDASGDFLFRALHRAGFANQPYALSRTDELRLTDLYITAVCHCVPPQNKPNALEVRTCQQWLKAEMQFLDKVQGIVLLGKIAMDGVLALPDFQPYKKQVGKFAHGALYPLGEGMPWLLCSYHPSQQNTQTGRLTETMFDAIWQKAKELLV